MLAASSEVTTNHFEAWARAYVRDATDAWQKRGSGAFHINREIAWERVLNERVAMSPAAFFATEPEEPRYRAAFHAALTDAVLAQAEVIAASGDANVDAYDVTVKNALTGLIARADGFDNATIAALRMLRRRDPNGAFSLLGQP